LFNMPNINLVKSEIRQEPDGRVSFILRAPIEYSTQVPKGLLRQPPKWAEALVERGTTFVELVQTVGEVARRSESRAQRRSLLGVVEQLAMTDEGRQTLDRILTPGFISWLVAITAPSRLAFFIPAIIVFENANAPGKWGWITPWDDEEVWPVATLQQLQLDQTISAVWQDNIRPFVELFLFDGPDLQGRLTRIVRVQTAIPQLELVLDAPSLNDQSRSLVGSVRSIPGRRFSAEQELSGVVTQAFSEWVSQSGVNQFGTASLVEPPQFSWDGYDIWLSSGGSFPPMPKTAALRIRLVIRIDDILYGTTTASGVFDYMLKRTGGVTPVAWVEERSFTNVPDPWRGDVSAGDVRWGYYFGQILGLQLTDVLVQGISLLAGASPGSLRILPGRSTGVPNPPSTHWGLIELGRTDDDCTIVLSP
jgi:hypothetical protein